MEEACIEVELKGIAVTTALVRVNPGAGGRDLGGIFQGVQRERHNLEGVL